MESRASILIDRPTGAPPRSDGGGVGGSRRVLGLDGLRGFALLGMLAWHAELDWVRGGFARMTIFFVLSGYLATRSWDRRRAEGFRSFWLRRTLRLLPMTLIGVAVAIAVTVVAGSATTKHALAGDALSVLTYTSNWHFLDTNQSYGELFERQSAFQHYWSLSIEEQLFLLLPVLLAGGAWLSIRLRRPRWVVLGAAAAVVGVGAVMASPSPDGVYFGTQTRLLEFLVGAALAVSVASWSSAGAGHTASLRWCGRIAALAIVVTLVVVDRGSAWLYEGGIHLFALPVVAVIAAVEIGDPWLSRVLGFGPFVWLGRAALSIYVLHWPLFVLIDDLAPSGWSDAAVAALKVAVGVSVGGVAHRLLEQPMLDDTRRRLRSGLDVGRARLMPMVGVAVLLGLLAVILRGPASAYDFDDAQAAFTAERPEAALSTSEAGMRVGVFGGSTALMNGLGLIDWSATIDTLQVRDGDARLGCGLLQTGERPQARDDQGEPIWSTVDPACGGWPAAWQRAAGDFDIALVFLGVWEIADWRLDGGAAMSIDDPELRSAFAVALDEGVDRLLEGGVRHVVLMTTPIVGGGAGDGAAHARGLPADHAARTARFNDLLRSEAQRRPGEVSVFDYAAVVEGLGTDLPRLLPDGVHPTWAAADEIWGGSAGRALLAHLADIDG